MKDLKKIETSSESSEESGYAKRLKYLTTIAILFGNITFGCAFQFYNPALEDLRTKYDTTVDDISVIFSIILVSYCCGALSSGVIYNYMNRQLGVILCLGGMASALFITPFCPSLRLFFIVGSSLGYFVGAYDAAQVVWIIEMWGDRAGPFIQCQHFMYAVGTAIPPFLMGIVTFINTRDLQLNFENDIDSPDIEDLPKESNMLIPCSIGGIMSSLACVFQIFLFIFYRYEKQNPPQKDEKNGIYPSIIDPEGSLDKIDYDSKIELAKREKEAEEINARKPSLKCKTIMLVPLTGLFFGAYQGMEISSMQFIPTYGQYSDLALSESQAALVLTGLTGAFTIGRFLGIFIIMKVPPLVMLFTSLILVIGGNCILLLWAHSNLMCFWTGCILLGFGFSTMYASFCAFIMKHVHVTNAIGSFIIVSGSTLAAVYPIIVGRRIADNAVALTYTNFFSIGACTLSLTFCYLITRKSNK